MDEASAEPVGEEIAHPTPFSDDGSCLISRLHDEILSEIFGHVVRDFEGDPMPSWPLAWFLLAVTRVSRRWRRVAVGTPRIWRNVWSSKDDDRVGASYISLATCVQRSRAVPLNAWAVGSACIIRLVRELSNAHANERVQHLYLDHGRSTSPAIFPLLPSVWGTGVAYTGLVSLGLCFSYTSPKSLSGLLRQCDRIRALDLIGYRKRPFHQLRDDASFEGTIDLPALEHLRLLHIDKKSVVQMLGLISAPRLSELAIIIKHVPDLATLDMQGVLDPFHHMRKLTIGGPMTHLDLLSILRHTPRVLTLQFFYPDPSQLFVSAFDDMLTALQREAESGSVFTPNLRSLAFHCRSIRVDSVLCFLTAQLCATVRSVAFSEQASLTYSTADWNRIRVHVKTLSWIPAPMQYTFRLSEDEYFPKPTTFF